jgi:hypothetical protein
LLFLSKFETCHFISKYYKVFFSLLSSQCLIAFLFLINLFMFVEPIARLHPAQHTRRLSTLSDPPFAYGITCEQCHPALNRSTFFLQQKHLPTLALLKYFFQTCALVFLVILCLRGLRVSFSVDKQQNA